jgi:hypothetical protein
VWSKGEPQRRCRTIDRLPRETILAALVEKIHRSRRGRRCVKSFAAFLGRSPRQATPEELRAFQVHQTQTGVRPSQ